MALTSREHQEALQQHRAERNARERQLRVESEEAAAKRFAQDLAHLKFRLQQEQWRWDAAKRTLNAARVAEAQARETVAAISGHIRKAELRFAGVRAGHTKLGGTQ